MPVLLEKIFSQAGNLPGRRRQQSAAVASGLKDSFQTSGDKAFVKTAKYSLADSRPFRPEKARSALAAASHARGLSTLVLAVAAGELASGTDKGSTWLAPGFAQGNRCRCLHAATRRRRFHASRQFQREAALCTDPDADKRELTAGDACGARAAQPWCISVYRLCRRGVCRRLMTRAATNGPEVRQLLTHGKISNTQRELKVMFGKLWIQISTLQKTYPNRGRESREKNVCACVPQQGLLGPVSTILRILNYFKEFNENPFPGRITRQCSEKTRFFLISVNRP